MASPQDWAVKPLSHPSFSRWVGSPSMLGNWWSSSRPEGLRRALFRLSSPWPRQGSPRDLLVSTEFQMFSTQPNRYTGVPEQRGRWSKGWSPQSSVRAEIRSPPRPLQCKFPSSCFVSILSLSQRQVVFAGTFSATPAGSRVPVIWTSQGTSWWQPTMRISSKTFLCSVPGHFWRQH